MLITLLGIALIGAAGCSISEGSGLEADSDIISDDDGSVDIETGWFEGDDEVVEVDDDEAVAEGEDEETEDDDDAASDSDDSDESAECSYPMHVIETGTDEISLLLGMETAISINVTGGSGDFLWYTSNTELPAGMAFEEGDTVSFITGAPLEYGTFQVSIRVKDLVCERYATKDISIEVNYSAIPLVETEDVVPAVAFQGGQPFVKFTIREADAEEMRTVVLYEDSVREFEVFRDFQPAMISVATTVSDGTMGTDFDRYTIKAKSDTGWIYKLTNNEEEKSFFTDSDQRDVRYRFTVTDTETDDEYTYDVILHVRCALFPLKDAHIRLIAQYNKDYDKAFCHKESGRSTKTGFGLTCDTIDFEYGYYKEKFRLTSKGDRDAENTITDNPKVIYWHPEDREGGECLEDITTGGFFLDDDGCAGWPLLGVKAIEVKACEDPAKIDPDGGSHGCYFATYAPLGGEGVFIGISDNGASENVEFPLDEDKEGNIWSDESKIDYLFDDYDWY
jgi:hypothetical protein